MPARERQTEAKRPTSQLLSEAFTELHDHERELIGHAIMYAFKKQEVAELLGRLVGAELSLKGKAIKTRAWKGDHKMWVRPGHDDDGRTPLLANKYVLEGFSDDGKAVYLRWPDFMQQTTATGYTRDGSMALVEELDVALPSEVQDTQKMFQANKK